MRKDQNRFDSAIHDLLQERAREKAEELEGERSGRKVFIILTPDTFGYHVEGAHKTRAGAERRIREALESDQSNCAVGIDGNSEILVVDLED